MSINQKLLWSLLVSLLAGCQLKEQSAASEVVVNQPNVLGDKLLWPETRHLPPAGAGDTLTAAARALLRRHNLAPLWARADYEEVSDRAMEGFYGPDNYRIAFYFDQVRRDSLHSERFLVRGRNRYRKVITLFTGTITVRAIFKAQLNMVNHLASADTVRVYAVRATYQLREDPTTKGAGVYQGEALLDVYEFAHGELHAGDLGGTGYYPANQGGGLTFRGTWTANQTGRRCRAVWADNLQMVTPLVVQQEQLANGLTGDVDPALAKRGWNEQWQEDTWWTPATPAPASGR